MLPSSFCACVAFSLTVALFGYLMKGFSPKNIYINSQGRKGSRVGTKAATLPHFGKQWLVRLLLLKPRAMRRVSRIHSREKYEQEERGFMHQIPKSWT